MAVYHVKSTGTKTTGSSTPDDWTDANCYATTDETGWWNIAALADGDEIILDDEVHSFDRLVSNSHPAGGGTVTLKSRSGVAANCTLSTSRADFQIINFNPAGSWFYIFEDFTLTLTGTFTKVDQPILSISGNTENVTFTRIAFSSINQDKNPTTDDDSALITSVIFGGATSRTLTFADCTWNGVTSTFANAGTLLVRADAGTAVAFTGTNIITNNAITITEDASGGRSNGYFWLLGNVTQSGTITATNNNSTVTHADAANRPVIYCNGGTGKTVTLSGTIAGDSLTWSNGASGAALLMIDDTPYTVNTVTCVDSTSTPVYSGSVGLGCTLLITRPGAQGTIVYVEATRCGSYFGPAIYYSQGGGGTCKRVKSTDCNAYTGAVYFGGHGDITLHSALVTGTGIFDASQGLTDAVALYSHIVTNGADSNAVRQVSNATFADNYDDGSTAEMILIGNNTTYSQDMTLNNIIFEGLTVSLEFRETAVGGVLNVTTNNCAVETAKIVNDEITGGTWTNNGQIDASITITNDFKLPLDSAYRNAGKFVSFSATDIRGRRRPVPPSLGAYEPTSGDLANTRTVATTRTIATVRTAASTRTAS